MVPPTCNHTPPSSFPTSHPKPTGIIEKCLPPHHKGGRGELEITDVNNYYIGQKHMGYRVLDGCWNDVVTFGSLLWAGMMVEKYRDGQNNSEEQN